MVESFRGKGFGADCEFIYADNTQGNSFDGFTGYNTFLTHAQGDFVILCHQDVLLLEDGRDELDRKLAELSAIDPLWAVCGNAGGKSDGNAAISISDPKQANNRRGPFPSAVTALDENFMVVRRAANLGLTPILSGFHLYAVDLCISAAALSMNVYVIDFHLLHKGLGKRDNSFFEIRDKLQAVRGRHQRLFAAGGRESAVLMTGNNIIDRIGRKLLRTRYRKLVYKVFGKKEQRHTAV